MTNSRQKGKRGELEAAAKLRELGFTGARRGQQFKGGQDSPDIADAIPGVHIEVKRVEALNIHAAMMQSIGAAGGVYPISGKVPIVMHRRNHGCWMLTMHLDDLPAFVEAVGKEWIRCEQQEESDEAK